MARWIVVAALALGIAARPARACTSDGSATSLAAAAPDVFTWTEQADAIAEVEVTSAPGFTNEGHGLRGAVVLAVRATLKGKPGAKIEYVQELTPCGGQSKGVVQLGFFDARRGVIGFAATATKDAIVAWQRARTPADQLVVLAKLAASSDPSIAGAVAKRLAATWNAKPSAWKAPGTAALAVARVRELWPVLVAAARKDALAEFADAPTGGRCKLAATRQACSAARARIVDVEGAHPRLVLGALDALGSGDCWNVGCAVGFYTLVALVGADGRLLVVWIPPEG